MENKKISSQYPSRSYGNRQQPEKKVKKAGRPEHFALVRPGGEEKVPDFFHSCRHGYALFPADYGDSLHRPGDAFFRELRKRLLCLRRQLLFHQGPGAVAVLGIVIMILVSYFDYHHLHKFAMPVLGVFFPAVSGGAVQPAINQVHRWVQIGTFSFMASEVTKFAIVLSFAHLISINFKRMDTFRYGILPYLIILVPTLLLLAAEPHISCIAIVVLLAAGMLFIGGVKLRWFVIALSVIVGAILYLVISPITFLMPTTAF